MPRYRLKSSGVTIEAWEVTSIGPRSKTAREYRNHVKTRKHDGVDLEVGDWIIRMPDGLNVLGANFIDKLIQRDEV